MPPPPDSPENDPNLSGLGRALMGTNEGSKPSGPWVPPTAEELHQILPQYEIVKMLGRGGMGAVYMGRQTALDRPVAIKILSAQLEESDMGFTERFKNEARAMGKLNHPAIVSVYEFGQHESGLLYIVMEYVDGTDVAKMIAKSGRLHTEHAMAITAHVCDALAYAHERGIIHRDIKPANVMVDYDGSVKIADFGLAKVNTGGQTLGLTQSGMAMGTLHFMAPEALMLGTAVDHRADIYAVGVMLYQMLTGKLPQGVFSLPSLQVPGLDPRYDTIIAKAMMEDREERYQSAREMRSDLDGILTQPVVKADPEAAKTQQPVLPTQARPQRPGGKPVMRQSAAPGVPQPAPRSSQSWLWMSALGLLVLGGAAWWMIQPRSQTAQLAGAPEKAASEPSSPMATAPATPGATHEEGWMPFLSKPEDFPANSPLELRDGWVVKKAGAPTSTLNRGKDVMDGAIRAEFTGLNCTLRVRSVSSTSYNLLRKGDWLGLQWERWDDVEKKRTFTTIKEVTLPEPPGADESFMLELRTVGRVITGSLNGREVLRVENDRGSKAGLCGLSLGDAKARKIEQLILDPQSNLAATTTPSASTDAAVRMILGKGGTATILHGKEQRVVTRAEELPKGGYEVVELRLIAPANQTIILSIMDMQTLAGLAALERFILRGVTIAEGDLSVLRTLPRLADLEFRAVKGLKAGSFAHLAGMRSLRHLRSVDVAELNESALPAILALPQLETLDLHGCKGVNAAFIESLAALPKLNFLTLSGMQINQAADLGKLRSLTKLALYDFSGAALDAALAGLGAGNKINRLAFHGGELAESQMQKFAKWPGLDSLLLEATQLPAAGLAALSDSSIRELDAGSTDRKLDDSALLSASRISKLKALWLAPYSPATEAGIAAFRKARPDVKITRRQASTQAGEDAIVDVAVPAVIPPAARPAVPPPPSAPTPLPKTDPPTWIDTQGRSLQAKFVRVEGANVLLEIAGKVAPAALNTLSAASQQQARDLQAETSEKVSDTADSPAQATKDRPFVNSLGMKFVPVPGTKVLMCIHETRRADYQAFCSENPSASMRWKNERVVGMPDFVAEPAHPVFAVNWNDSKAFCDWIGTKEGLSYRLPTDREWSVAIGIANNEKKDASPEQLSDRLAGVFQWGKRWPPPAGSGNLRGEESAQLGRPELMISRYNDGFAGPAPVMSYKPNEHGLFDMSGNVMEWCEDWFNSNQREKVLRSSPWYEGTGSSYLLASHRFGLPPDVGPGNNGRGFRVVLELPDETAAVAAPASPLAWIDAQGRSIQAKFVRVEGANVLLEIAGKAAPVALNTLSAASQQQARDLQAQLPAAVTVSQAPSVSPTFAASPPPLPNTTVITPGWRPMFPDEAALRATPGVTQLADGWWRLDHVFFEAPAKARNLRLRVHARFQVGAAPSLIARWDSLNPGRGPSGDYYGYQATFYDTGGGKDDPWVNGIASVSRRNGRVAEPGGYRARNSPRFKKDLNLRPGDEYDMEFELVGENFKLGIDEQEGALIGFASCPGSGFGLFSQGALEVSRMEWQELDEKGKVIPAAPPEVLDWTDTQGKVLRGQFKGMDIKGNVLLDLSGRITPVPWSLLSPASQRQVRAVHAPSTLNSQP
jgi:serine/threonine protein kinase